MTAHGRRLAATLALSALLAGSWLTAPPRPAVARGSAGPEPARIIPDGMPYDSTRGDSVAEAALYLSWGAPHGMPGARQDVAVSCGDTSRVDTLYLSIETGRDLPRLFGMFARIAIRPAPGDSLGPFWGLGKDDANRGGLLIQMDADGTFPCTQPWLHPGVGGALYEFSPGQGDLTTIYAVTPEDAAPISGRTRHCFARLLLLHRRCGLEGARKPVCIEWREGGYSGGGEDFLVRRGSGRFASVNSPDGSVCAPWRRATGVGAWRPSARALRGTSADSTRR